MNDGNNSLYDDTLDKLNAEAKKENKTIDAFLAYDIQFESGKKQAEPKDGSVSVSLKWKHPVKPETVQDDDAISLLHIKDDGTIEDLTKEKDKTKNHGTVKTDANDDKALTEASITSDSFSIYTVVWSRDNVSSLNVHYVDENGTEIRPVDTVDVPADGAVDPLAKTIEGYTYDHASVDQVNITELKTENGRLSFYDGSDWKQTKTTDVYLTYTADPVEETPPPAITAEPSESPEASTPQETVQPAETPEVSDETRLEAETTDGSYHVTVSYGKDAGLPAGTKLSVKQIAEDNAEYENAKNAVAASENTDADALGMAALDITLTDEKGNKAEPEDHSKVKVEINAGDLPSNVTSIDIHHIKETTQNSLFRLIRKAYTGTSEKAEEVKKNVAVTDGQAAASFEVSSFSTFTITWTKDETTYARVANITVHYVDSIGNELTSPAVENTENLFGSKVTGDTLLLSTLGQKTNGDSRIEGYSYLEARLGSAKDNATVVTALRARKTDEDGYVLQYQSDDDETWLPLTGISGNTAEIYLIYQKPVHVHFVDTSGNPINNGSRDYNDDLSQNENGDTFDAVKGYANPGSQQIEGYQAFPAENNSTYNDGNAAHAKIFVQKRDGSVSVGNISGEYIKYLKYTYTRDNGTSNSGSAVVSYSTDNRNWTDLTGDINVYVVYVPYQVTVHYVDLNGHEIAPSAIENAASLEGGVSVSDWAHAINNYNYQYARLESLTGSAVSNIKSEKGNDSSYSYQYKGNSGADWQNTSLTNVYLVYKKAGDFTRKITIHYVDMAGYPITDNSGNPITKEIDAADWNDGDYARKNGQYFTDAANPSAGNKYVDLAKYADSFEGYSVYNQNNVNVNDNGCGLMYKLSTGTTAATRWRGIVQARNFRFVRYNPADQKLYIGRGGYGESKVTPSTDNNEKNGLDDLDVYLFYPRVLRIHYVDTGGKELYDTNNTSVQIPYPNNNFGTSTTLTENTYYNGHGTPEHIYYADTTGNMVSTDITKIAWQWSGSNGSGSWKTQLTPKDGTATTVDSLITDVYMVYPKSQTVTIHHIDEDGNPIEGVDDQTVSLTATRTIHPDDSDIAISGYTAAQTGYFGWTDNNNRGTEFTSVTYTLGNNDNWSSTYSNSSVSDQNADLPGDLWIVYRKSDPSSFTLTAHQVDQQGNTIGPDKTVTIDAGNRVGTGYNKYWNGYSTLNQALFGYSADYGTYKGAYIGERGQDYNWTTEGILYYYDSDNKVWHTAKGSTKKDSSGNLTDAVELHNNGATDSSDTTPVLYDEIWLVYGDRMGVTVHHVDEAGNPLSTDTYASVANNGTVSPTGNKNAIKDYVVKEGHIGNGISGPAFTEGTYTYDSSTSNWSSAYKNNETDLTDIDNPVKEITIVYTNATIFTVHYVDTSGTKLKDDTKFTLPENSVNTKDLTTGDITSDITKDSKTYAYTGSYLGSNTTGIRVRSVSIKPVSDDDVSSDSRIVYHANVQINNDGSMTQLRRDAWSATSSSGRTFTLRKAGTNFSLVDSQLGNSAENLNLKTSSQTGSKETNVYTDADTDESSTVHYQIIETITTSDETTSSTYKIVVTEDVTNSQTDVYQIYDVKKDEGEITLKNDMIYSGNLVVEASDDLKNTLTSAENVKFTWHRVNNSTDADDSALIERTKADTAETANTTVVSRKSRGSEWNLAYDENSRTWLNVSADEGARSDDNGYTSVKYYCVLTYTTGGTEHTVISNVVDIPYYDQLENGDFESPDLGTSAKNGWQHQANQTTGYISNDANGAYGASGGVWKTTAPSPEKNSSDGYFQADIEIVNTRQNFKKGYNWHQKGENDNTFSADTQYAKDGKQFAELNAEAAGALYQDVVTLPNQTLNYWLSHRARGVNQNSTPEYDTMYLVIMPTKLAMTSAENGGELTDQTDLESFIQQHGGFTSNKANAVGDTVTYRNEKEGILIERISSDDQSWHSISVANGYTATSNLTRFFFVAASTAAPNGGHFGADAPTQGNFLDAVGFSQKLPNPVTEHFQMVVTKTFSGLEAADFIKLATNRRADGSVGENENPFKLKINGYADDTAKNEETDASLDGAELTFSVDDSGNLVLAAKDRNGKSLLSQAGNNAKVTINDTDGSVTMTWTFLDNEISGTKYYKVTEDNDHLNGYTLTSSQDGSVEHSSENPTSLTSVSSPNTVTAEVNSGDVVRINNTNAYRDNRHDGQPIMTVQKTFTGETPSVVNEMLTGKSPYKVILTKDSESDAVPLTLVGNSAKPYEGSSLRTGISSIQFSSQEQANGSTILTWNIIGTTDNNNWVTDDTAYSVKEENFKSTENGNPSRITVSDGKTLKNVTLNDDNWPQNSPSVTTGVAGTSTIKGFITSDPAKSTIPVSQDIEITPVTTNFIVASYVSSGQPDYFIWTEDPLHINDRAKVLEQIGKIWSNATAANTSFQSGEGTQTLTGGAGALAIRYDSGHMIVRFTETAGNHWEQYYAGEYSGGNSPEIQITNAYEADVRVKKISSDEAAAPLEGAEFKLYTYNNVSGISTKQYLVQKDAGVSWGEKANAITFKTNRDGVAVSDKTASGEMHGMLVTAGTYYLEETKAPDGYNLPAKNVVVITVDNDGIVTQVTDIASLPEDEQSKINTSTTGKDAVTVDWNSQYYTVTVKNTAGSALPNTGGIGTYIFYIAGAVLIIIAGVLLVKRKKAGDSS